MQELLQQHGLRPVVVAQAPDGGHRRSDAAHEARGNDQPADEHQDLINPLDDLDGHQHGAPWRELCQRPLHADQVLDDDILFQVALVGHPTVGVGARNADSEPTASQDVVEEHDAKHVPGHGEDDRHHLGFDQPVDRPHQFPQLWQPHQAEDAEDPRQTRDPCHPRGAGLLAISATLIPNEAECQDAELHAHDQHVGQHPRFRVIPDDLPPATDQRAVACIVHGVAGHGDIRCPIGQCRCGDDEGDLALSDVERLHRDPDEVHQQHEHADDVPGDAEVRLGVEQAPAPGGQRDRRGKLRGRLVGGILREYLRAEAPQLRRVG
mmetsp:Transcript_42294/g.122767  ORF Transcript_42294/g.122767 Transcript_42294/m.122767 type:complete len:322 (+) Transcript_42294:1039-2004(+)